MDIDKICDLLLYSSKTILDNYNNLIKKFARRSRNSKKRKKMINSTAQRTERTRNKRSLCEADNNKEINNFF